MRRALVPTSTLKMQPSLKLKSYMPFPVGNPSEGGLFPNFNTTDPVQKAVINHTFGASIPPTKKQLLTCGACELRFNSFSQAEAHYRGSKHAKKLKTLEAATKQQAGSAKEGIHAITLFTSPVGANDQPDDDDDDDGGMISTNGASQPAHNEDVEFAAEPEAAALPATSKVPPKSTNGIARLLSEPEEERAKQRLYSLYCSLCKVGVNSPSQLEAHNMGSKHKSLVQARTGAGPIQPQPGSGSKLKLQNGSKGSGLQSSTFHCEICDVHVNSETQLKQHVSSRRHKDRVADKPVKPKYIPYNKLQRSPSIVAAKPSFQRDLMEPMAPAFLSSSLASAVSSPLSMRPRPMPPRPMPHYSMPPSPPRPMSHYPMPPSPPRPMSHYPMPPSPPRPMPHYPLPPSPPRPMSHYPMPPSPPRLMPPRPSRSLFQASVIPSAFLRPRHGPMRTTTASMRFAPYY